MRKEKRVRDEGNLYNGARAGHAEEGALVLSASSACFRLVVELQLVIGTRLIYPLALVEKEAVRHIDLQPVSVLYRDRVPGCGVYAAVMSVVSLVSSVSVATGEVAMTTAAVVHVSRGREGCCMIAETRGR